MLMTLCSQSYILVFVFDLFVLVVVGDLTGLNLTLTFFSLALIYIAELKAQSSLHH